MNKTPHKINMPDDLWMRVRQYAFNENRSIASIVCEALEKFLRGKGQ